MCLCVGGEGGYMQWAGSTVIQACRVTLQHSITVSLLVVLSESHSSPDRVRAPLDPSGFLPVFPQLYPFNYLFFMPYYRLWHCLNYRLLAFRSLTSSDVSNSKFSSIFRISEMIQLFSVMALGYSGSERLGILTWMTLRNSLLLLL